MGKGPQEEPHTTEPHAGPEPLTPPSSWILFSDYPHAAIIDETGGRMHFTLKVNSEGIPTDCTIIVSSKSTLLDQTGCEKLLERARFHPAEDEDARAVPSVYHGTIVWQLPAREPLPPEANFEVTYTVDRAGAVIDCQVLVAEGAEAEAIITQDGPICPEGSTFIPAVDDDGKPVPRRVRSILRIIHEDVE